MNRHRRLKAIEPGTGFRIGAAEGVVLAHRPKEQAAVVYGRMEVGAPPKVSVWSREISVVVLGQRPVHVPRELLDRYLPKGSTT